MGHASIQTTIDRYGHVMTVENYSEVGVRMDSKIYGEPNKVVEPMEVTNKK